jgi:hypothetical protein
MGTLGGYLSLHASLHPDIVDLIIELDRDLGSVAVPLTTRQTSWSKHMGAMDFPKEWPTTALFPKSWLYGEGQFNHKKQTAFVQRLIVRRMLYLWTCGVTLIGKGKNNSEMSAYSMCQHTSINYEYFQTFEAMHETWTGSVADDGQRLARHASKVAGAMGQAGAND